MVKIKIIGNNETVNKPILKPSWSIVILSVSASGAKVFDAITISVTVPISCGPTDAPKSPPAAKRAKIITPPLGSLSVLTISVPGHNIEENRPDKAQAIMFKIGSGERAQTK